MQEFKIVEEVWPHLKMKNKVGHTSSTILNSCSFQRYSLSFWNLYSILLTQALPLHIWALILIGLLILYIFKSTFVLTIYCNVAVSLRNFFLWNFVFLQTLPTYCHPCMEAVPTDTHQSYHWQKLVFLLGLQWKMLKKVVYADWSYYFPSLKLCSMF